MIRWPWVKTNETLAVVQEPIFHPGPYWAGLLLGRVTIEMEERTLRANDPPCTPYWFVNNEVPPIGPPQAGYPSFDIERTEDRINPMSGREYLQMLGPG